MADDTPDTRDPHAQALERFKLSADSDKGQRERELEDIKFVDFDEQWPDEFRSARAGGVIGMPGSAGQNLALPARPCLTINKLRQPVEQVTNQARQARLSLQFAPKSGDASQDVAAAYEDIVRERQTESRAHLARQWAFERAAKCGRGWYRILTDYANDGDCDLDIIYKRILNQASVFADPSAQEPDWSDGEWLFMVEDIPWDRYKRTWPESQLAQSEDGELVTMGVSQPEWVRNDKAGRAIRVAEYWRVKYTKETVKLYQLEDGTEKLFAESEVPPGAKPVVTPEGLPQKRTKEVRSVEVAKMNAVEFLREPGQTEDFQPWAGSFIPFIPVIGKESNANGERRWVGIVRPSMDSQRSYNVERSELVYQIGLGSKSPWVAYAETIEGYEQWWNQANVRAFPWLPIKAARDAAGNVLPPPQRNIAEAPIQAITVAISQANDDIFATSGQPPVALGQLDPHERSGKAVVALQRQAELGSSGYIDNLANLSMMLEGKIMRDLIPKVYFRPGRVIAAMGADDQRRVIMVGVPFIVQNGRPVKVPEGTQGAKLIDLSQGEYSVAVTVGKSFTTRREEGMSAMGEVLQAVPEIFPIIGDLYVGNMDFPGARQMADRLKKTLPPNLQDDQNSPEIKLAQLEQQMQKMGEQMQLMTQELEAKTKVIETDAIKNEANLRIKQVQEQAENERAMTEAQLKQAEIQSKYALEMRKLEVQLEIEMAKLGSAESMKRGELEQEQLHAHGEALLRQQEMGASQAQADMDRQNERDVAEAELGLKAREGDESRRLQREEGQASRAFEAEQAERGRLAEQQMAEREAQRPQP